MRRTKCSGEVGEGSLLDASGPNEHREKELLLGERSAPAVDGHAAAALASRARPPDGTESIKSNLNLRCYPFLSTSTRIRRVFPVLFCPINDSRWGLDLAKSTSKTHLTKRSHLVARRLERIPNTAQTTRSPPVHWSHRLRFFEKQLRNTSKSF